MCKSVLRTRAIPSVCVLEESELEVVLMQRTARTLLSSIILDSILFTEFNSPILITLKAPDQ